jgi:hypothetical protein
MCCLYVDALDGRLGVGVRVRRGKALLVEGTQVENQEDETVLAAIVGERELR